MYHYKAFKLGRLANGYERDKGSVIHALPVVQMGEFGTHSYWSLCGTTTGNRSAGWKVDDSLKVTCQKCLKKIK